MSDEIKHECGLAYIRLRKPFSYYQQKYGAVTYGLNKLYLLMEKQHNRGQDGAGIASIKLNVEPGYPFLHRMRSAEPQAISGLFKNIADEVDDELTREDVAAATAEVVRMSRLVNGLLALAKAEGMVAPPEPDEVAALVEDRFEVWSPVAAERGVRLVAELPEEDLRVLAGPGHLE